MDILIFLIVLPFVYITIVDCCLLFTTPKAAQKTWIMRDFKNLKSGDKPVLQTCNNNDNSSSGDYPESVVLESSAK